MKHIGLELLTGYPRPVSVLPGNLVSCDSSGEFIISAGV